MEFDVYIYMSETQHKNVLQFSGGVINDEMFPRGVVWFPAQAHFRPGWGEFDSFVSCPAHHLNSSSGGQARSRRYDRDP